MKTTVLTSGTYEIKKTYTNAFASTIYELEDGTKIFINYDQTNFTIHVKE